MVATQQRQRGGAKPAFPDHMDDSADDMAAFFVAIEATETEIARLTKKRDSLQRQMYRRFGILRSDIQSHKAAACGSACRQYTRSQPTAQQLVCETCEQPRALWAKQAVNEMAGTPA